MGIQGWLKSLKRSPKRRQIVVESGRVGFETGPQVPVSSISQVLLYRLDDITMDRVVVDIDYETPDGPGRIVFDEDMPGYRDLLELLNELPGFTPAWGGFMGLPPFDPSVVTAFAR